MTKGASGVHPETLDRLVAFYNAGVEPVVPSRGSIGAGDLVANAHLALPVTGLGEVWSNGKPVPAEQELARLGLSACDLHEKDAMALINHSCVSTAMAARTVISQANACLRRSMRLSFHLKVLRPTENILAREINMLRPAEGQEEAAHWFRKALEDSRQPVRRIQDPLSYRLTAVIFGAVSAAMRAVSSAVRIELNGVTDSPAVLPGQRESLRRQISAVPDSTSAETAWHGAVRLRAGFCPAEPETDAAGAFGIAALPVAGRRRVRRNDSLFRKQPMRFCWKSTRWRSRRSFRCRQSASRSKIWTAAL